MNLEAVRDQCVRTVSVRRAETVALRHAEDDEDEQKEGGCFPRLGVEHKPSPLVVSIVSMAS